MSDQYLRFYSDDNIIADSCLIMATLWKWIYFYLLQAFQTMKYSSFFQLYRSDYAENIVSPITGLLYNAGLLRACSNSTIKETLCHELLQVALIQ